MSAWFGVQYLAPLFIHLPVCARASSVIVMEMREDASLVNDAKGGKKSVVGRAVLVVAFESVLARSSSRLI